MLNRSQSSRRLLLCAAAAFAFCSGAFAKPPEGKGGGNGGGGKDDGNGSPGTPALVFSAEGKKSWDLFVTAADGSSETQLTSDQTDDRWPAFSPDGTQIAFLRERTGDSSADLYLINADGTGLRLLKDFVADQEAIRPIIDSRASIDWSPDGTMIVLNGLYVLDVTSGEGSYVLGEPGAGDGWQPAWSPDGSMIAFDSFVEDPETGSGDRDLFLVDLATLQVTNLTPYAGDQTSAAWSPDGSKIAFVEDADLLVLDLNEGATDVVVEYAGLTLTSESRPSWTPDGGTISFAAIHEVRSGIDYDLFHVSPTGSGLTNVSGTKRRWEFEVDWNPAWN